MLGVRAGDPVGVSVGRRGGWGAAADPESGAAGGAVKTVRRLRGACRPDGRPPVRCWGPGAAGGPERGEHPGVV